MLKKQTTGHWKITGISETFFIRMYWETGKRARKYSVLEGCKREDADQFQGFDGLLLYLDETCEQNGVLLRKAQVRRCQKRRRYLETGNVPDMEQMKKSGHAAIFWLKVMGRVCLVSGSSHLGKIIRIGVDLN